MSRPLNKTKADLSKSKTCINPNNKPDNELYITVPILCCFFLDDFARKALEAHNRCRQVHQVSPLTWSSKLAREAQAWVNKIAKIKTLKHATREERNGAGENIAMFSDRLNLLPHTKNPHSSLTITKLPRTSHFPTLSPT